jgi:hypothetical protein
MLKKKARQLKSPSIQQRRRNKQKGIMALSLILSLGLASFTLSHWKKGHKSTNLSSSPPQASQAPQSAKEYIYAGGRLIATEEPTATAFAAPSNLIATTRTGSLIIDITWSPVVGATYYRVERSLSKDGPYTALSGGLLATSLVDSTTTQGIAYLYRVCVADNQGNPLSAYSNLDLATAVSFADDPLGDSQNGLGTTIQARHITQLREAINAVRVTAGLPAAAWDNTHPATVGQLIYANHILELRQGLEEARSALNACCGVNLPGSYSAPNLAGGSAINRASIQELRDRVK